MQLIIIPKKERQTAGRLDTREGFETFLHEHNVKAKKPFTPTRGAILLWDGRAMYQLMNLPPRKQWQHLIKEAADYPESITRTLLERKAKRKAAHKLRARQGVKKESAS
jgi:hypothetical protein